MTKTAPPDQPLIRLRSARDVLATVPRLLGYRPRRSIVFLNLHDGAGVSTLRVDLPAPAPDEVEKGLVASFAGMLCKVPDVRTTVLVVYADGPFDAGGDVPRASFIRPLVDRLTASGFVVHDALCVADDGWGAYDGIDAGIPRRLDELDEPAPGDDGREPAAVGVAELSRLPTAGFFARRAFELALERAVVECGAFRPVTEAEAALALDPARADSDELARLFAVLLCPELRDVVLFTWCWGPERGLELIDEGERIDAGEVGPDDDSIARDLMGFGRAGRPDRERVERGIRLLMRVAAVVPDDLAHVAYTVLAWLHWSQGRGSVAGHFVDRARELDRSYGLAELLQTVVRQGHLPGWAYLPPGD